MVNIPPTTPERKHICRTCGKQIFWHRSKQGKGYPCDSPNDRRDFHKCDASTRSPNDHNVGRPKPATTNPPALTPNYFEPSLEQRVESVEKQLAALVRTVQEVQRR